jgi:hypothetical protein
MVGTSVMDELTSLAILKVNWDERRKDYLDNFIPFVEESLRRSEADEVSSKEVKARLQEVTGFDIPEGVVRKLLHRLEDDGVRRVNGTYYRDLDALNSSNLEAKSNDFQRKTAALVGKLQEFANENWEVTWTEEQTEDLLLDYVGNISTPLLHASRSESHTLEFNDVGEHSDYIISAFVKRCLEKDPEGFDHLESVAKGAMMANVVYYENPNVAIQKFDSVAFYLDTPFLLDALGINGDDLREARTEMMDLLQEAGAELRVFPDTISEMRGVVDAEARKSESTRRKRIPTARNPIQSSLSSSDLRLLSEKLPDRLGAMQVRVEEKADFEEWMDSRVDEKELEDRLIEAGYNENKPTTLRHDVEALLSVFRLRKAQTPGRLENCTAAFVTTNPKLVHVATDFFADQLGNAARDAPPCVLNDDLAARVWLKMPNEAPDLPRKQLLAHSYAALLPEDAVLDKYLQKIQELKEKGQIGEEDYIYLRSLQDVGRVVADVSMNDEKVFTEADVEEIRRRKEAEIEARAVEAEEKAKRAEQERKEAEKRRAEKEKLATEAKRRAEREERRRRKREQRDRERAESVGWWTERVVWGLLMISLLAGAWLTLLEFLSEQTPNRNKIGIGVLLFLSGLGGGINALVTSNSAARKIGECAERQVLSFLQPDLTVDTDSGDNADSS